MATERPAGGAIKEALAKELPRLAKLFRFYAYSYADRDRLPEWLRVYCRRLSLGSTLLAFASGSQRQCISSGNAERPRKSSELSLWHSSFAAVEGRETKAEVGIVIVAVNAL